MWGLRSHGHGYDVYAPFGFDDLFSMSVGPNRVRELPQVYCAEAHRWASSGPT
ncbi:nucleotidyltransferase family protein [Salinisphaera sp. SPP-AMP-43]|uniref:nucleotidyltransferase family protein n=1 Tax=Salinisphaera sp. SPP-AMP-43 TaxID=3121288 RepID=UPI003C6E0FF1